MNLSSELKVKDRELCPICSITGKFIYRNLTDRVFGSPGNWSYRICAECEVIWLDPLPSNDSIGLLYPQNYLTHEQISHSLIKSVKRNVLGQLKHDLKLDLLNRCYGYALSSKKSHIKLIAYLLSYVDYFKTLAGNTVRYLPQSSDNLLDIGCGNGNYLSLMSELGWNAEGVEPDELSTKSALSKGLKIYNCSIYDFNFKPDYYKAITLNHVIEHLYDPLRVIKQIADSLVKGGYLYISLPNYQSLLSQVFKSNWRQLDAPRHLTLFSEKSLMKIVKDAGFCNIKLWTNNNTVFWMARESISLAKYDNIKTSNNRFVPAMISMFCNILRLFKNQMGEDLVLIARKT